MNASATERLWTASLVTLAACVVLVTWFPLLRIGALPSINYNEGWNAYRQSMALRGTPLYAAPPTWWITNYPSLSFHLVGTLGATIGNIVLAGRLVAVIALIALASLTGGTVRMLSGSARVGTYAGLCLVLWVATFTPERRAMNDPGLLGAAFASLGLFAYAGASGRPRWLGLSALAFAVSLFTKQDLLALPLGVGAHLASRGRSRELATWVGVGMLAVGLLTALTFRLDGRYFLADLLRPRAYLAGNLAKNVVQYLLHFGLPLALCTTLLLRGPQVRARDFLLILLAITHLTSCLLAGGDGVAQNVFYPSMIALAVASSVAIDALDRARASRLHPRKAAALMVPVLAGAVFVPFQLDKDLLARRQLPVATLSARAMIAALASTRGPAICEDILLCYEAGKAIDYDPFFVDDQISTGRIKQSDVLAMLAAHRYAAIEIEPHRAGKRRRFSQAFMRTLSSDYRLVAADDAYLLFEPRDR